MFALDCTNCEDLELDLFDDATSGDLAAFEFLVEDSMGPLPNQVLFSELASPSNSTELPVGGARLELFAGLRSAQTETLAQSGQPFEFQTLGSVLATSAFTVPQPNPAAAEVAALLCAAAPRRGRRRGILSS